jgi:hypothetical protein
MSGCLKLFQPMKWPDGKRVVDLPRPVLFVMFPCGAYTSTVITVLAEAELIGLFKTIDF